jgi:hypothetical protein
MNEMKGLVGLRVAGLQVGDLVHLPQSWSEGEALIAVHYPDKWVYRGRWAQVRAATLQAAVAEARAV